LRKRFWDHEWVIFHHQSIGVQGMEERPVIQISSFLRGFMNRQASFGEGKFPYARILFGTNEKNDKESLDGINFHVISYQCLLIF